MIKNPDKFSDSFSSENAGIHSQLHTCAYICKRECSQAGTTLRKHAPSPLSVNGLQTKTTLHGSALKGTQFTSSATFCSKRTPVHTHQTLPDQLQPSSTLGGAETINTGNTVLPYPLMQHFTFLAPFLCLPKCRPAKV